jgi:hypothetical protein
LILLKAVSLACGIILGRTTWKAATMCDNLSDRSLRLRRLALDFRVLAQKPGLDALVPRQLLQSAAELEALACAECAREAPSFALDDVVWEEAGIAGAGSPDEPAPEAA